VKIIKLTPIAIAILTLSNIAIAQSDKGSTSIVVVGSPIIESNNVNQFSHFSTIVSAEQVKDLGALDLAAALRMTPGVQISRYNEVGSYNGNQGGAVYIRGSGASRPGSEIKTYIDGIPVYVGVWNHSLLDILPMNGMQSIEILKGPHPQVNGNNFSSINLESKKATENGIHGDANVAIGSFGTKVTQATILGRDDRFDFMLAASHVDSNGARPNSDSNLNNVMGKLGFKIDNNWSAGVSFLTINNRVGDPGDNRLPVSSSNGVARNNSDLNMLTLSLQHQHGNIRGEFKVYDSQGNNNLFNDPTWGTFNTKYHLSGFKWKEELTPWTGAQVVAGIDQDRVEGDVSGPQVGSSLGVSGWSNMNIAGSTSLPKFITTSPYIGINQKFNLSKEWVAIPSIGIRYYDSNIYGSKPAPNAGLSLVSEKITIYANYSEGLLYPGVETVAMTKAMPWAFSINNGWNQLSPTENSHKEIGFKAYLTSSTEMDMSYFQDDITNRYVWTGVVFNGGGPVAAGTWTNNYPKYRVNGLETSVKQKIASNWNLFAGFTLLDSSIAELPYLPKAAISLGINGNIGRTKLVVDAQNQSGMYALTQDRGGYNPTQVNSFTVANARISYPIAALGKKGEIYGAINNIFDASYQYNPGYPMPGRNYRVGLIASF
jgi:outer membrane cobalamin receptor